MPLVVLDPVVLVNTGKMPDGPSAKLLTLLAYGRVTGYLGGAAEAEERMLRRLGAPLGLQQGWAPAEDAYANSFEVRKELDQSIPAAGRGMQWGLALSEKLIDRVVRRVGKLRDTDDVELDAGIVAAAVSAHASRRITERWKPPRYTDCADSNVSIHTALLAGAQLVITKLPAACEPDAPKIYHQRERKNDYPLGATAAVHFDFLIPSLCQEFDFHAIDASVLERIAPSGPHRPQY